MVKDQVSLDESNEEVVSATKLDPNDSGAFALFNLYTDFREQLRMMAVQQLLASNTKAGETSFESAEMVSKRLSDLAIRHAMERAEELVIGVAFPPPGERRYTPEEVRQMETLPYLRKLAQLRIFQRCLQEQGEDGEAMLKKARAQEAKLRKELKKEGIVLPE